MTTSSVEAGRELFVSHSSQDATVTRAICDALEGRGIRCWIAPRDVSPGRPYAEQIVEAIDRSAVMLLVLSTRSGQSPHVRREIERAATLSLPIIPFRIEECEVGPGIQYFIGDLQRIDAVLPPLERHIDGLAAQVSQVLSSRRRGPESGAQLVMAPLAQRVRAENPENYNTTRTPAFQLTITSGSQAGVIYLLSNERITVGRASTCDIQLNEPFASRAVFALNWDAVRATYNLVDFGTRHGVLLNGTRVVGDQALDPGDVIAVGRTEMCFDRLAENAPVMASQRA